MYISVLQMFRNVAGVDTVSRAWKSANPGEIKDNWTSLYEFIIQRCKGAGAEGGGGREVLGPSI